MKALILAAGYAIRLYPLTINQPKPLLKVAEKPIVSHILEKIEEIEEIDEVFVVTNNRFYTDFTNWLNYIKSTKKITIVNDETLTNADRLGAIGDIDFVIRKENVNDDLLVIAGDNLFGFSMQNFINFFKEKKSSITAFHDLKDIDKVRGKFGVGIVEGSKVIDFEEKPLDPRSSLAATACYVFGKEDLKYIKTVLARGDGDSPGDLPKCLVENSELHGFVFEDYWYDIGSFESLKEANEKFSLKVD